MTLNSQPPLPELTNKIPLQPTVDILRIADSQVALCWAVLGQLVGGLLVMLIPPIHLLLYAVLLGTAIAAFACYRALFGIVWAIILTALTFVPLLGFFILVGTSSTATKRLHAAGLTVGFMGVGGPERQRLRAAIAGETRVDA